MNGKINIYHGFKFFQLVQELTEEELLKHMDNFETLLNNNQPEEAQDYLDMLFNQ